MNAVLYLCATTLLFGGAQAAVSLAAVASAAASAITAGSSLASGISSLLNDGYRVTCGIEVENWTRWPLVYPHTRIGGGALSVPPSPVLPSKREAMVARKNSGTATGTYGTVSWEIQGLNRRVYIMWSAPFNFDHHSNWLAVGLSRRGYTSHPSGNSLFNQMYYSRSDSDIGFSRSEYHRHISPVIYRDDDVEVVGVMGSSHKAHVKVIVRPVNQNNLATPIKALLQQK